jgi:hypothetical protein
MYIWHLQLSVRSCREEMWSCSVIRAIPHKEAIKREELARKSRDWVWYGVGTADSSLTSMLLYVRVRKLTSTYSVVKLMKGVYFISNLSDRRRRDFPSLILRAQKITLTRTCVEGSLQCSLQPRTSCVLLARLTTSGAFLTFSMSSTAPSASRGLLPQKNEEHGEGGDLSGVDKE